MHAIGDTLWYHTSDPDQIHHSEHGVFSAPPSALLFFGTPENEISKLWIAVNIEVTQKIFFASVKIIPVKCSRAKLA